MRIYQKLLSGNFSNEFDSIIDSQEKAFCKRLVLTALRKHQFLRSAINNYTSKSLPQKLSFSHLCIFLGATEILFFSTPEYAAVNSYVAFAKKDNKFSGGFVNAILRKICQNKDTIKQQQNIFFPKSFRQLLQKDYTKTQIDNIESACTQEPPLDITVKNNAEEWAKKLEGQLMPNGSIRLFSAGNIPDILGYEQGQWWVQDFSSSLAIQSLNNIKDKKVLELCAAPGGKTAQLTNEGAKVTSVEISPARIKTMQQNLQRLNFEPEKIICEDAIAFLQTDSSVYDIITIDAPCSATGTLRRHPEIVHTRTTKDIAQNQTIQKNMLETAASHVADGGTLLYSVCSLSKAEGEEQIRFFLKNHQNFKILPITFSKLSKKSQDELKILTTEEGFIRCLPYHFAQFGGIDGFFVAQLQKEIL
ncbi:MAG: RsmB/NOP family class I SAM-dependent RNA methyltransferase [Alphaproteobacteria bacterium]|nr:RsmB/NOP family class I SAM-dependent RNA methyltransferase [Alphaproteobacteria bacterium]